MRALNVLFTLTFHQVKKLCVCCKCHNHTDFTRFKTRPFTEIFFFFRVMENNLFVFRMQLWRKVTRFCGGMGDVVEMRGGRERKSLFC